jgi:hypothetical protein
MKLEALKSSSKTGSTTGVLAILIGVMTALVPAPPAWADRLDYRVGGGAYLGVTDNALGVPNGTPGSETDGILLGRVDGGLVLRRPFSEHRVAYAFTASMYVRQSGGRTLSNSLGWESAFTPSATLRLTIAATGNQGRLSALDTASTSASGGPPAGPTGPRPAAAFLYASADVRQGLSWEFTFDWRLLQSLSVQGFWPLNSGSSSPSSYSGDLGTGIERTFLRDGLSLNLRGVAMQSSQYTAGDGTITPLRRNYTGQSDLGWRHTWTPTWSHYLSAGAMAIEAPPGSTPRFKPTAQGSVMARTETKSLAFRVERTATPNVFAGNIFVTTRGVLTASAGFGPRQEFDLRVLGSYDRASAVSQAGVDQGGATVYQARLVGTYGAPGPLYISLEYAFTDQEARIPENVARPMFFTFHRHLVMVGVEYRYSSLPPLRGARRAPGEAGDPAEDSRP